jgi:hypothetical protein
MAMRGHDHGFRDAGEPTVHQLANTGVTMWDVGEMVFGKGIPSNAPFQTESVICFDTPFGRICLNLKVADLRANEADAKKMTLQDALGEVLNRPRLKGICFTVCTPIGCFQVCP